MGEKTIEVQHKIDTCPDAYKEHTLIQTQIYTDIYYYTH